MTESRSIIVSTGDISDVDGFFALAEYAKTDSDVVFVMNYPAYIGIEASHVDPTYESVHLGLGYKYSAKDVMANLPTPVPPEYDELLHRYRQLPGDNGRVKAALTDLAFDLCRQVWAESSEGSGRLYFCVGGVNSINPFSSTSIKHEILVYSSLISQSAVTVPPNEGATYTMDGEVCDIDWSTYSDLFIDFNGSMAFLNDQWLQRLAEPAIASKIRGAFVMGGVHAEAPPLTMPAIPNVLNRFSSATMNQLYHPQRTALFLEFVAKHSITTYTVTNNVVEDLTTFADAEKKVKTLDGVHSFLSANDLTGPFLRKLAECYYTSRYSPPRKAYDFYTARALRAALDAIRTAATTAISATASSPSAAVGSLPARPRLPHAARRMFYCARYATTLVSGSDSWAKTLSAYVAAIDTEPRADDAPFVKTKKDNFRREIEAMHAMPDLPSLPVCDLAFHLDPDTRRLTLSPPAPPDPPAAPRPLPGDAAPAGAGAEAPGGCPAAVGSAKMAPLPARAEWTPMAWPPAGPHGHGARAQSARRTRHSPAGGGMPPADPAARPPAFSSPSRRPSALVVPGPGAAPPRAVYSPRTTRTSPLRPQSAAGPRGAVLHWSALRHWKPPGSRPASAAGQGPSPAAQARHFKMRPWTATNGLPAPACAAERREVKSPPRRAATLGRGRRAASARPAAPILHRKPWR